MPPLDAVQELMADYYPLIAKAVAGLEKSTGEARRALYERARAALVAQLRGVTPPLAEADITRERLSLEEAIRKVESEAARRVRPEPPARPVSPPTARPDVPPPEGGPLRPPPPTRVSPPAPPGTAGPAAGPAPPGISAPAEMAPERQRWAGGAPTSDRGPRAPLGGAAAASRVAAPAGPAVIEPPPAPDRPSARRLEPPPAPPFFGAADGGDGTAEHLPELDEPLGPGAPAPPPSRGPGGRVPPPDKRRDARPDKVPGRPPEPRGDKRDPRQQGDRWAEKPSGSPGPPRRPSSTLPLRRIAIAGAAVLLLLAAVAAGLWNRSAIVGYFHGTPTAARTADNGARPKIADRIGGSSAEEGAPVAQKVVLYEEDPNDPGGKRYVGSAVWRLESVPPAPGKPPDLAIRADIEIPEQKISARWSLRRNDDKALPASHTVEVMFTLPPDFPHKGITNIPGVLMKQSESTRGVPLAGLAVKVTNNFFLIGLSSVDTDRTRNLQLLKERAWFDIPLVYEDGRRAIIAIEKGTPGERAFARAFDAWGQ